MVSLEKDLEENTWKDSHPIVMLSDVRGKLHYSKQLTDELRNNDLETLKDVLHAQSTGNAEVH